MNMVVIKNKVRTIPVNTTQLKKDAQMLLEAVGYPDFDLGILLTTNKTMRKYNREYRNKDKPTDILSFPFYPKIKPGQRIKPKLPGEKQLGDIIISLEMVKRDAKQVGVSFKQHLRILLVHGISHLLGYTHGTQKEFEQMQEKERSLREKLKRA